ncbi:MAG TPA: serine hydrolase [Chitinophagaceae bacterium]|nr:serine hydrolase [Chitinophagaceae bacterium]
MIYKRIIIAFIVAVTALNVAAQDSKSPERLKTIVDSVLQSQVDSNLIPGAVIEIKKDGKVLLKKAFGFAQKYDYNHRVPAHPEKTGIDYMYDLASLTKVVGTTTSIMLLVDRGKLKVDDRAGKYIPAFNSGDKKTITIRNLLTHTAGIDDWYPLFYRAHNKQEAFQLIGELPLKYPVGAGRHYSDLGFTILGEIIEKISGQSMDVFMQQNIFKPLGMLHTAFNPLQSGKFTKIAATSHGNPYEYRMVRDSSLGFTFKEIDPNSWNGWRKYTLRGEVNDGNAWYAEQGVCGAAGLFSTIDDLQKLVDMLLHKGRAGNKQFISEKTLQLFLTKDNFKNGLGWMMDPDNPVIKNGPPGTFGHTGFTGTSIAVIPEYNASVIMLINRQNMGLLPSGEYYNLSPVRREIFTALLKYCENK